MSIVFTREEFTKMYGEHPDWMWEMLAANHQGDAEAEIRDLEDKDRSSGKAHALHRTDACAREIQELVTENTALRRGLEEICAEWNEDCEDDCDSVAHSDQCKYVSIAEAKRAMRHKIENLESEKMQLQAEIDYYKRRDDDA